MQSLQKLKSGTMRQLLAITFRCYSASRGPSIFWDKSSSRLIEEDRRASARRLVRCWTDSQAVERKTERAGEIYRTGFILTTKFCLIMIILLEAPLFSPGFTKDGITGRYVGFVHLWFTTELWQCWDRQQIVAKVIKCLWSLIHWKLSYEIPLIRRKVP